MTTYLSSDTKTVTITGKTNVDYSDNTSLGVSIGPTSSDDSDYSKITEKFTLTSRSFPSNSDFSCTDNTSTCISWSDNFTKGQSYTSSSSQVTSYNDFWNSISVDDGWTNISIGNPDNLVTCDNASEIIGLYKSGSDGSLVCNNKTWYVGSCGSGMSIAVNSSGDCQCGSNSWTVRPGIGNNNWGGVGKECSAESQTLTVVLDKASSNSSQTDNLSKGLVAYYPFNGNSNDVSGNLRNLSTVNATLTLGKDGSIDSAYEFGSNKYLKLKNTTTTTIKSLSFWVYHTNNTQGQMLWYVDNSRELYVPNGNKYRFSFPCKDVQNIGNVSTPSLNEWHSVILNLVNNKFKLYINGTLQNTVDCNQFLELDNEIFYIGSKLGFQLPFQGKIDEFRIYDRALTSSEISLLYTSNKSSGLAE